MIELLEKFKVGNTAVIGFYTEDDELNDFLDDYGNRVVITEIEEEDGEPTGNFWGVNLTHKVHCPYHLELRDVTNIDETNHNVEDFADFKCLEDLEETLDVEVGNKILIKTVEEYEEDGDEVTELVEKFAGQTLEVVSVSSITNEFGERYIIAQSEEGDLVSFTEHEIAKILRGEDE